LHIPNSHSQKGLKNVSTTVTSTQVYRIYISYPSCSSWESEATEKNMDHNSDTIASSDWCACMECMVQD